MSGLASLVLSMAELTMIDKHCKDICQNIQKLHTNTPNCFIYFLGGCLPARAVIHFKQLTLFGMISRLPNDPLNIHARNILITAKPSSKSWFCQIRDICLTYQLPHPLQILSNPPTKEHFRKTIKSKIVDHWETKLRKKASSLSSLKYFNPCFMSLTKPHPIWTTAGSNPYEVAKSIQQARFLSGRYRTEYLCRHWSANVKGFCLSPTCDQTEENIEHILLFCGAYTSVRDNLTSLWLSNSNPIVHYLAFDALTSSPDYLVQFILDCSVLPRVITAVQDYGKIILDILFYLTRTWCFSIHRQRMKMVVV